MKWRPIRYDRKLANQYTPVALLQHRQRLQVCIENNSIDVSMNYIMYYSSSYRVHKLLMLVVVSGLVRASSFIQGRVYIGIRTLLTWPAVEQDVLWVQIQTRGDPLLFSKDSVTFNVQTRVTRLLHGTTSFTWLSNHGHLHVIIHLVRRIKPLQLNTIAVAMFLIYIVVSHIHRGGQFKTLTFRKYRLFFTPH